jgi:hypothetical protein
MFGVDCEANKTIECHHETKEEGMDGTGAKT